MAVLAFREYSGSSILQICRKPADLCRPRARGKGYPATRADLADVEGYARGDFLADLIKGEADLDATTGSPTRSLH